MRVCTSAMVSRRRIVATLLLVVVTVTSTVAVTAANRTVVAPAITREQCYTFYVSPSRLMWPGDEHRERKNAERTGTYVPRNVLFTKVQMLGSKAFVLSPRYRPGVPFTVGHFDVADPTQSLEPAVAPFPSAGVHECGYDNGRRECLANAVDFALDDRGVLWTLDAGIVHTYDAEPLTIGPPKIWGFDGTTGDVVLTVDLSGHTTNRTVLQFIAADHAADYVVLYVSDSGAGCLLVYNGRDKIVHRLSFPALARSSGVAFSDDRDGDDDVLYMEYVKRRRPDGDGAAGQVLLTYYAGRYVFTLDASSVLDSTAGGVQTSPVAKNVGAKPVRMAVIGSDGTDNVYFRHVGRNSAEVYSWRVDEPLAERSFVLRRRMPDCRRPTHAAPGHAGLVWLLETDVADFVAGRVGCMGSSSRLQAIVG